MGMIALAYMYQDGIGTSADPVSAKYWTDRWQAKVTAEKHAQEQQKDRANVQKALMLAIIMSFMDLRWLLVTLQAWNVWV